jgi:hypothetical protein
VVQVLGVGPANQGEAVGRPQQAVDGAVGQFPGARRVDFLAGCYAVKRIQHAAVRHHHDLLARMARGQRVHGARHPLAQLQQRLAAFRRLPLGNALAPVVGVIGPGLVDLVDGLAFEHAEAAFAQAFVGHHRNARHFGDGLRRLMGATQIAGIHGTDPLGCQRFAHAAGLPAPGVIQADVLLPLDAGGDIPGGFAVTHGNDPGGFHSYSFYGASRP